LLKRCICHGRAVFIAVPAEDFDFLMKPFDRVRHSPNLAACKRVDQLGTIRLLSAIPVKRALTQDAKADDVDGHSLSPLQFTQGERMSVTSSPPKPNG
jgi:hypothetical protein